MKTKKLLSLAVCAVITAGLFAGCSVSVKDKKDEPAQSAAPTASAQADASWDDIKAKGKFIVGLDDQFPPMGFRDDKNEIVGVDVDLAKAVAKELGVEVEFKPIDWKTKEMELNTKKIDVIWNGFTITDERKQAVLFSHAYMDNTQAIVVKDGSALKTKKDLAGKKVGVQGGSSAVEAMEKDSVFASIGKDNVATYDTIPLALLDLKSGRIDAVVADEVVVRYDITKSGEKYIVLSDNFSSEEYGVGFRKADTAFKTKVDEAFAAIKANGEAKKIAQKWFGEDGASKIK